MEEIMYGCVSCAEETTMDRVKYLMIHPDPINLPGAGYLGYGAPIAAPHSSAPNVGEYNGWVSLAKQAMTDLAVGPVTNVYDEIDGAFTDGVYEFQSEYADLYGLTPSGWLDPATVKAIQDIYEKVLGPVPPLVPVYMKGDELIVGYPSTKKSSGVGVAFTAIGLTLVGLGVVGLVLGFKR
jgi:hypothetical protein